jgi:Fe/S biogenesis protein NfuA
MITFTDKARQMVFSYLKESDGEFEALRVRMVGSPLEPEFELSLIGAGEVSAEDSAIESEGIVVVMEKAQAPNIEGAQIDFVERVNESGFEVTAATQNGQGPGGAASGPPTGDLAEKVQGVLDDRVNPSIAAHGGSIDLVHVEGTEITLLMSGGCQGCAMSKLTLRQGVEKILHDEVPEITAIHDATDHESGANPYFSETA